MLTLNLLSLHITLPLSKDRLAHPFRAQHIMVIRVARAMQAPRRPNFLQQLLFHCVK